MESLICYCLLFLAGTGPLLNYSPSHGNQQSWHNRKCLIDMCWLEKDIHREKQVTHAIWQLSLWLFFFWSLLHYSITTIPTNNNNHDEKEKCKYREGSIKISMVLHPVCLQWAKRNSRHIRRWRETDDGSPAKLGGCGWRRGVCRVRAGERLSSQDAHLRNAKFTTLLQRCC